MSRKFKIRVILKVGTTNFRDTFKKMITIGKDSLGVLFKILA